MGGTTPIMRDEAIRRGRIAARLAETMNTEIHASRKVRWLTVCST
jgi:hypothetical protein